MLPSVFANFGSLRRAISGMLVASAFVMPTMTSAQTVDFESLAYGPACQWGGGTTFTAFDGMQWSGFRPLDLNNLYGSSEGNCQLGATSGYSQLAPANVGHVIGLGADSAYVHSTNPFVLHSLVIGAGWQDQMHLTMNFYLGGVLKDSRLLTLNTYQTGGESLSGFYSGPTDYIGFSPDYSTGVDVFHSTDLACIGRPLPCTDRYQTWFVDNLVFSAAQVPVTTTPEPATVGMIAVGLLAMGVVGRKRHKE